MDDVKMFICSDDGSCDAHSKSFSSPNRAFIVVLVAAERRMTDDT